MWIEDKERWREYHAFRRKLLAVKTVSGAVGVIKRYVRDDTKVVSRRFWKAFDLDEPRRLEKKLSDGEIRSMFGERFRNVYITTLSTGFGGYEELYRSLDDECVKYFIIPKKGRPYIFDRLYTGRSQKHHSFLM